VRVCITGHPVLPAAVGAMHAALLAMREGRPADQPPPALMRQATRANEYERWVADYLGGAKG
jgi:hypothetical protein